MSVAVPEIFLHLRTHWEDGTINSLLYDQIKQKLFIILGNIYKMCLQTKDTHCQREDDTIACLSVVLGV